MKKKIICTILVTALAVTSFTGCGNKNTDATEIEVMNELGFDEEQKNWASLMYDTLNYQYLDPNSSFGDDSQRAGVCGYIAADYDPEACSNRDCSHEARRERNTEAGGNCDSNTKACCNSHQGA